ncbi:hypothetical protein E4U42_007233 [Claviceps africana]|uniref:Uncharacterized protein n=1 Tax=Claviceps africana TaxID=83212 RepID=A0A8K0JDA6_9HYPO|nr:hypothetical protein E4U42_007233 [Claviceps africana]
MASITGVEILNESPDEYIISSSSISSKIPPAQLGQPGRINLDMAPGTWTIKNGSLKAAGVSIQSDGTITIYPGNARARSRLTVVTNIGPT